MKKSVILSTRFKDILKMKINPIRLLGLYYTDFKRFRNNSYNLNKEPSFENKRAEITFLYHAIEKGLMYDNMRYGFGEEKIKRMIFLINKVKEENLNILDNRIMAALSVLDKYSKVHKASGNEVNYLENFLTSFPQEIMSEPIGGINVHYKERILEHINDPFNDFSQSRHSVRNYSAEKVSLEDINEAIKISLKTPSVCNRQSWKVQVVQNPSIISELLAIQGGINGMGNNANTLLMISADNSYFGNIHERNQGFVDGGMFSMSLLYAFHNLGLATCALNANLRKKDDLKVRKILNISDSENIVMFMTVGNYPEKFNSPKSYRDKVEDICTYTL